MVMNALTLPVPHRRASLRGFWLTLGALTAALGFASAWWNQGGTFVAAGLAGALAVGSVGYVRETFARRVYRAWNRRLVRPFNALAARIVMAICFFIVLVAAGRARARMFLPQRGGAMAWTRRESLPVDAYAALFAGASPDGQSGAWLAHYLRWASRTGNLWSVALLPFLAMLTCLAAEPEKGPPANIYTLF
jgi:hypothetical protein